MSRILEVEHNGVKSKKRVNDDLRHCTCGGIYEEKAEIKSESDRLTIYSVEAECNQCGAEFKYDDIIENEEYEVLDDKGEKVTFNLLLGDDEGDILQFNSNEARSSFMDYIKNWIAGTDNTVVKCDAWKNKKKITDIEE